MKKNLSFLRSFVLVFGLLLFWNTCTSQYFGRNKPRYRSFNFKVRETPHYKIYNYLKDQSTVDRLGQWSEMWYDHHLGIFKRDIPFKNPILFYNNHAEFQQNNAISGAVGPSTGGVTEALKNRVVMPLTFTHQQTNHVLGHELVHAFQFNTIVRGDSTNLNSLRNLPLWMSEGLAEYLSLGGTDSHTALWMRDAVANDDIPTINDLEGFRYFPYRYGHAMWAHIAGRFGDDMILPIYENTGQKGVYGALDTILNTTPKSISVTFAAALKTKFGPIIENRDAFPDGKLLLNDKNSGNLNVSPALSPDGKYFVYLSEKDLISTDLFLADARDGKIIRKLVSLTTESGLDHLNYMESTGAWSPDGKQFIFVAFKKGKNVFLIKNTKGDTERTISIPKVPALSSPAWSPDGRTIVFSGMVDGQVDLYQYDLRSKKVEQLTNDIYSEIGVNFSPDGNSIVFSYDKRSFEGETYDGMYTLDLAVMDLFNKNISILPVFFGADNVSPNYDHEGNILFLSDRDGFRDLYKYEVSTGEVYRLTTLKTGITGITQYSPAISVSKSRDRLVASVYYNRKYSIHRMDSRNFNPSPVNPLLVNKVAAKLPLSETHKNDIVDANLVQQGNYNFIDPIAFKDTRYDPQFKLDYVGGGAGVGVNNNNFSTNTVLQGGVQGIFSDILGNHQLFGSLALNGELLDFGGQFSYINRANRLAYGFGVGHIPLRTGFQTFQDDQIDIDGQTIDVLRRDLNIIRVFNESVQGFVHYPFNTNLRLEGGVNGFYQFFRQDLQQQYYATDAFGRTTFLGEERMKVETGDRIQFDQFYTLTRGFGATANLALVGDNASFGLTGPIAGYRYRLSIENQIGIDNFFASLIDARKYWFVKPFTFAVRALNYNRFEQETNTVYPLYIGTMGFVRGYADIYNDAAINPTINFTRMTGSKIGMVSAELRLPFFGPRRFALIPFSAIPTDLILFIDSGVVFDDFNQFREGRPTRVIATDGDGDIIRDANGQPIYETQILKPLVTSSAGISFRFNLGNVLILEPFYARQLVKNGRWDFGLNFIPGW